MIRGKELSCVRTVEAVSLTAGRHVVGWAALLSKACRAADMTVAKPWLVLGTAHEHHNTEVQYCVEARHLYISDQAVRILNRTY